MVKTGVCVTIDRSNLLCRMVNHINCMAELLRVSVMDDTEPN